MFKSFSLPFGLPGLGWGGGGKKPINLSAVPVYETENKAADKRTRRLHNLIKLNHANYSIIYNHLRFHNHTPHILGSSYIFGASAEKLTKIYEIESRDHEHWRASPNEITKDDWRDYLGKPEYQRAYIDFFEDELVEFGYDWKKLLDHYLYVGDEPLINSYASGLGHPLIHLGYAYELGSGHIAIEALGLTTCFYSDLHKYIDDPKYTRPAPYKSKSVLEILEKVRNDARLDGKVDDIGGTDIDVLAAKFEDVVLDHWNAWDLSEKDAIAEFEGAQTAVVALVVATPDHPPQSTMADLASKDKKKFYDFFLLHTLTTSHALRILMPIIPGKYHINVVRSWFLFLLLAYIGQRRPRVDLDLINNYPLEGDKKEKPWEFVTDRALNSSHYADPHFVKGLRAMMVAEEAFGVGETGYWRKAAVRMATEFAGWAGSSEESGSTEFEVN